MAESPKKIPPNRSSLIGEFELDELTKYSISFVLATVFAIVLLMTLRFGANDPINLMVELALVTCFPILLSIWILGLPISNSISHAFILTAGLIIGQMTPLLGLYAPSLLLSALAIVDMFLLIAVASTRFHRLHASDAGWAIVFAFFIIAALLTAISPLQLMLPEAVSLGLADTDSYFHVALANMISGYGIAATGMDGLTYHPYHHLSHYPRILGLAKSAGTHAALVYVQPGEHSASGSGSKLGR